MEHTRVTESRTLVREACLRALDAYGEEPSPPLTGEASEIGASYGYMKPLLESVKEAHEQGDPENVLESVDGLLVESLFLLARSMEMTDLYSDNGMKGPLTAACYFALGSYMEQEGSKEDQWRDEPFEALYGNAKDELGEIRENLNDDDLDNLLRNSVDLVLLVGILYAAALDRLEVA